MGRHPYAGRYLGSGDMPIETAITDFRYAYGNTAAGVQMSPPPQTLPIQSVMPKVARLFERAFMKSSENPNARPTAQEWYRVLQDFRESLTACPNDIGHQLPKSLNKCPWCDLEKQGAPNFFISVSVNAHTTKQLQLTFDVQLIWAKIANIPYPNQYSSLYVPTVSQIKVIPTALPEEIQQSVGFVHLLGQISIFSAPGCVCYFVSPILALLFFVSFVMFGILRMILNSVSGLNSEKQRRQGVLYKARFSSKKLKDEVNLNLDKLSQEFQSTRRTLIDVKTQVKKMKSQLDAEISRMRNDRERIQREAFLKNVFISDHKIDKIGPGRLSQLSSYGIETAYDIEWNNIRNISGFGETITANLWAWRNQVVSTFRFDHSQPIPPSELQSVLTKYAQYKKAHTLTLENGLVRLNAIRQDSIKLTEIYEKRIFEAMHFLAQAEADVTVF